MNREEAEKILTHGEWFLVKTYLGNEYLIQFKQIIRDIVFATKVFDFTYYKIIPYNENGLGHLQTINELRPATKQEVLKYFPYEVFPEPKERFKVPIIKAPSLKDELKDIMEELRYKGTMDFTNPIPPRKRPITRNKKQYILR